MFAYLLWLKPFGFGQHRFANAHVDRPGGTILALEEDLTGQAAQSFACYVVLFDEVVREQTILVVLGKRHGCMKNIVAHRFWNNLDA